MTLVGGVGSRGVTVRRVIRRHFPDDRSIQILDVGCGDGAFLLGLKRLGYVNIVGIDFSGEQVLAARGLGFEVMQRDVRECLPSMPSEAFDVIIAFDVLEHFDREDGLHLTREVARLLRPQGRFIVHVPNAEGIFSGAIRFGDLTHEAAFTRHSIRQLLRSAGFQAIDVFEDRPPIHGFVSFARWCIWMAARSVAALVFAAETGDWHPILSQNLLAVARREA
jgi:2-polyprenyl-3-methyl-5-hydroxy-6-metoxy-1,4-benzoquinol methylase